MNKLLIPFLVFPFLNSSVWATGPMSPSSGRMLVQVWAKSNATRFPMRITEPRNPGRRFDVEEHELLVIIDGDESEVDQRARRALSEANQRYWQRRIESRTMLEGGWYPEEAGWITSDGDADVNKWPWWVW